MGHDIYAYERTSPPASDDHEHDHEPASSLSYLRRSAFDPANKFIYLALNAMHCYGGVSGNGNHSIVTRAEIERALNDLKRVDTLPSVEEGNQHPAQQAFLELFSVLAQHATEDSVVSIGTGDPVEDGEHPLQPEIDFLEEILANSNVAEFEIDFH